MINQKIILERNKILGVLSAVRAIISKNMAVPVIENILLFQAGEFLNAQATDLQTTLSACVKNDALAFAVLLPIEVEYFLTHSKERFVTLILKGESVSLEFNGETFVFPLEEAKDFPRVPKTGDILHESLLATDFKSIGSLTDFQEKNPKEDYLSGVFAIPTENGTLTFIAASKYMAASKTIFSKNTHFPFSFYSKAGNLIKRLTIDNNKSILRVYAGHISLQFAQGDISVCLLTRQLDSKLPDSFTQSFLNEGTTQVTLLTKVLNDAVKKLNSKKTPYTVLGINGKITLSGYSSNKITTLQGKSEGKDIEIVFSTDYLKQIIQAESKQVVIRFNDRDSHANFIFDDETRMLMPVNRDRL